MDDGHIWLEIIIIILLVLANGVCSLAEIAIVGARKTKLQEMIDEGNKSAGYALRLAERKEELFSTIQVGITTISIITGMFSGASLSGPLGEELSKFPPLAPYAQMVSMVAVMVLVTYFSLIIGELAPKWIAIAIPEKAACFVARPMIIMATVCKPLVLFSTWSTKAVVGLLGIHMEGEQPVSEEEIKVLLQQGAKLGTFDKEEPEIIDNVFELNDRTAADCMTARPQLDWIDLEDSEKKIWADMMKTSHFRLPLGSGSLDDFKGLGELTGLSITEEQITVNFPMEEDPFMDFSLFATLVSKIIKACGETKRVRPNLQLLGDNEKYLMHSWLIRIGCGGPDFKDLRRRFTSNLTGYCAFPDQGRADKHKAKYAELRRIRREEREATAEPVETESDTSGKE